MNTSARKSRSSFLIGADRQHSPLYRSIRNQRTSHNYTPFGLCTTLPRHTTGFSGQLREAETGFYLLGAGYRAYSPALLRMTKPDELSPFGKGGLNTYAYCRNEPINRLDPTGRFFIAALGAALLGGGVTAMTLAVKHHDGMSSGLFFGALLGGLAAGATGLPLLARGLIPKVASRSAQLRARIAEQLYIPQSQKIEFAQRRFAQEQIQKPAFILPR